MPGNKAWNGQDQHICNGRIKSFIECWNEEKDHQTGTRWKCGAIHTEAGGSDWRTVECRRRRYDNNGRAEET